MFTKRLTGLQLSISSFFTIFILSSSACPSHHPDGILVLSNNKADTVAMNGIAFSLKHSSYINYLAGRTIDIGFMLTNKGNHDLQLTRLLSFQLRSIGRGGNYTNPKVTFFDNENASISHSEPYVLKPGDSMLINLEFRDKFIKKAPNDELPYVLTLMESSGDVIINIPLSALAFVELRKEISSSAQLGNF